MDHYSLNSSEESGWTSYLEDFCNAREGTSCFSVGGSGSSLLSDAASSAACNFSHPTHHHHHHHLPNPNKLSFKKTRTTQISRDDPLQDTATSPLNSPKVREFHPPQMISTNIHHHHQLHASPSMGKGIRGAERCSELEIEQEEEEKREMKLKEKSNIDSTDLKKRGLCLVPLSMLVNYFG